MPGLDQQRAGNHDLARVIDRDLCAHCYEPVMLLLFPGGPRHWYHDNGVDGYFCNLPDVQRLLHAEPMRSAHQSMMEGPLAVGVIQ